jgi:hypothetical protein
MVHQTFGNMFEVGDIGPYLHQVRTILDELGLKTRDIPLHYDLLVKMLTTTRGPAIAKIRSVGSDASASFASNFVPVGQDFRVLETAGMFRQRIRTTAFGAHTRQLMLMMVCGSGTLPIHLRETYSQTICPKFDANETRPDSVRPPGLRIRRAEV